MEISQELMSDAWMKRGSVPETGEPESVKQDTNRLPPIQEDPNEDDTDTLMMETFYAELMSKDPMVDAEVTDTVHFYVQPVPVNTMTFTTVEHDGEVGGSS